MAVLCLLGTGCGSKEIEVPMKTPEQVQSEIEKLTPQQKELLKKQQQSLGNLPPIPNSGNKQQ